MFSDIQTTPDSRVQTTLGHLGILGHWAYDPVSGNVSCGPQVAEAFGMETIESMYTANIGRFIDAVRLEDRDFADLTKEAHGSGAGKRFYQIRTRDSTGAERSLMALMVTVKHGEDARTFQGITFDVTDFVRDGGRFRLGPAAYRDDPLTGAADGLLIAHEALRQSEHEGLFNACRRLMARVGADIAHQLGSVGDWDDGNAPGVQMS